MLNRSTGRFCFSKGAEHGVLCFAAKQSFIIINFHHTHNLYLLVDVLGKDKSDCEGTYTSTVYRKS